MGHLIRDGVIIGGTNVYVDNTLSTTSENPVQNKVITNELNNKVNTSDLSNVATTGDYNDLIDKPIIDNTLSNQSTNAVQNKVVTNSLNQKYSFNYDVCLSLDEWEALGNEKYTDHKNYYIYDADMNPDTVIYGFHIDPDESDPSACVTYLEDAVNMVPAHMDSNSSTFNYGSWEDAFFMPKPCMVKYDGTVDYYLDPDDYKQKKDVITITSTPKDELPLSFNSVDNSNINYHFYGNSNGAGVETENLFDKDAKDTENGYVAASYLMQDNSISSNNSFIVSEYIPVEPNSDYYLSSIVTYGTSTALCFYDENKTYISGIRLYVGGVATTNITTPNNCLYIRTSVQVSQSVLETAMIIKDSTAPASYVPYGYKIPILLESEIVTDNLFDKNATDTNNGYVDGYHLKNDGTTNSNSSWAISEYIPIIGGLNYTFNYGTLSSSPAICYYDSDRHYISGVPYGGQNPKVVSVPQNVSYIRFSFMKSYADDIMFVQGNSLPDHYIPHFYQSNYDLFIGSTKLGADDFLDFERQKIITNIETTVFNGSENWQYYGIYGGHNTFYYDYGTSELKSFIFLYCNKYETTKDFTEDGTRNNTIRYQANISWWNINRIYVFDDRFNNINDFKDHLQSLYSSGDPLIVTRQTTTSESKDPPTPFPTIQAYQGENTLSSTETLNKCSIYAISDISNSDYNGNAMMEWPLIWWKYEQGTSEGEGYFYCSNEKIDDTYNCWCNINCDNQIVEHFYTAIYNGTGIEKLRSLSGVALTSANGNGDTTYTQESTRAMANNTTAKTEWFIDVWADRMLINGLLILISKSLNSQATYGYGLSTGGRTAKEAYTTGTLNDKGLFWGDISDRTAGVKVFGMENWWGCVFHRTAGLIGLSNGNTAYKMTYGTADGTTANGYNTTGEGYHINTVARPSNGNVKSCKFGDFGYLPFNTTGGSVSTFYTDYWYTDNSVLTFALVGGCSSTDVNGGVSFFLLNTTADAAGWNADTTLTLKPLAKLT